MVTITLLLTNDILWYKEHTVMLLLVCFQSVPLWVLKQDSEHIPLQRVAGPAGTSCLRHVLC